jgi:hypothetical protein
MHTKKCRRTTNWMLRRSKEALLLCRQRCDCDIMFREPRPPAAVSTQPVESCWALSLWAWLCVLARGRPWCMILLRFCLWSLHERPGSALSYIALPCCVGNNNTHAKGCTPTPYLVNPPPIYNTAEVRTPNPQTHLWSTYSRLFPFTPGAKFTQMSSTKLKLPFGFYAIVLHTLRLISQSCI